ncbi:hypothetical protein CXB51_003379 [Gossypium anomalum]|uniref:C2H2-type domain-containing protein n=1 Tax=Gossypium anomalum TaxID=47600 RepID=A0A8J5ZIT8_9ROSI|nr:hypothetical protein CXB51_003379 [Gossypium anomalum]
MEKWSKWVVFLFFCLSVCIRIPYVSSSTAPLQGNQGNKESSAARTFKVEEDAHVVRCSRERSRAAWKVIEEYVMPFVEQERYKISSGCRLHPDNDLYRDQEQHKHHVDINEWRCGYCRKNFYEEKYLDKHFDNRHFDLLNTSHSRCLADLCGALHCDLVMDSSLRKTKCNPAAAARNKHLCESLADSCFPVSKGPVSGRLHEANKYALHFSIHFDFDAAAAFLLLHLLVPKVSLLNTSFTGVLFWSFGGHNSLRNSCCRGIKSGSQELKRISLSGRKKKSF